MARRLLLVEDDPPVSRMLAQVLGLEGYEVTVVTEGSRALEAVRSRTFDAVVLDLMLPDLDGLSVMRGIRDDAATSRLPVVMLTAMADDESIWAGWRAGCDYYMTKPFDPRELVSILQRILAARPAGTAFDSRESA